VDKPPFATLGINTAINNDESKDIVPLAMVIEVILSISFMIMQLVPLEVAKL
jgi:hypothetical protein